MKGVTPVVATVLLITITVGAAGTLYTLVGDNVDRGRDMETDIGLNTGSLEVETCYLESDKTYIVLRNSGQSAVNASGLNLLLNNIPRDFNVTPEVADPQGTFSVEIGDKIGGSTDLTLTNGDQSKDFSCYNLPDGKPVRILSIGYSARQSEGGSAPIPPAGTASSFGGIYNSYDDSNILSGTRSYGVAVFNRTPESFIWKRQYDIHENGDADGDGTEDGIEAAGRLASDLNSLPETEDVVVVVATGDEPQRHRLSNGLESAMYSIGASGDVYGASNSEPGPFTSRSAYALVGSPGLNKGEAYLERYSGNLDNDPDSWLDVTYEIETDR